MSRLPFFHAGGDDALIAWRRGEGITRRQFRRDAHLLARRLPEHRYVLNHCEDRYHFLVGFAAALLRGQVSLFPPSRAPQVLTALKMEYPDAYCLTDQPDEPAVFRLFRYESRPDGEGGEADLAFPATQPAAITFTSGSTGSPRPYPKSWGALVQEATVAGRALGLDRAEATLVLATVPAQHMYGLLTSIMLPLRYGHVMGAERPFYPEDIRKALESWPHPAILVTTPVHIRACVLERAAFPALAFILSSTAPLDGALAAAAENLFGTTVREFFGSTETGAIATRRQAESPRWRTFDGIRVSVADEGFRVDAPYFPQPMILGDAVEVFGDREFALFGRNADLVKIAGKRISLSDLNRRLLAIEGVADGAFFWPEAKGGQEPRLAAFVVAPGRTAEDIVAALRSSVDPVFLPRPLRLVEALPRNATGKLPRGNLQQLLEQEAGRETAT